MSNASISTGRNAITQAAPGLAGITSNQDQPVQPSGRPEPERRREHRGPEGRSCFGAVRIARDERRHPHHHEAWSRGAPRFNVTQRFGTVDLLRQTGSRRFTDTTTAYAVAAAQNPTPSRWFARRPRTNGGQVPFYDYQEHSTAAIRSTTRRSSRPTAARKPRATAARSRRGEPASR